MVYRPPPEKFSHSVLGCAPTRVLVTNRGGRQSAELRTLNRRNEGSAKSFSSVEWNRVLCGVSGAQVLIQGRARCCDWADYVKPWKHEIHVFRGNDRVWSGPVTNLTYVGDELRINCKDRFEWLNKRIVHHNLRFGVGTDIAVAFNAVVSSAMSIDASPRVNVVATSTGVVIDEPDGRVYLADQHIIAMQAINELVRSGVDYTCVGQDVIVGGTQVPILPHGIGLRSLTSRHMEADGFPEVQRSGDDFGTRFHVSSGQGDDVDTFYGINDIDAAIEAEYGVVEVAVSEPFIRDNSTAHDNAQSRWRLNGAAGIPEYILSGTLTSDAPVDVNLDLIPGTIFRLALSECPYVKGNYRLASVAGSYGPEHDYVQVSFEPLGTTHE